MMVSSMPIIVMSAIHASMIPANPQPNCHHKLNHDYYDHTTLSRSQQHLYTPFSPAIASLLRSSITSPRIDNQIHLHQSLYDLKASYILFPIIPFLRILWHSHFLDRKDRFSSDYNETRSKFRHHHISHEYQYSILIFSSLWTSNRISNIQSLQTHCIEFSRRCLNERNNMFNQYDDILAIMSLTNAMENIENHMKSRLFTNKVSCFSSI